MRLTFVLIILSLASFFKSKAQVDQAEQYFQYADQFFLEAEYDSALLYIEKANSLFEQEEKWEMLVGSLNKTSEVYLELFQTSQARQTAQKAMDIIEKHLVSGHLAKSQVLHNLGNSYYVQGQHDEALTYYDKALDITDASQQDRKKSYLYTAPSNMGIGDVYFGRIEYDRALGYFENLLKRNKEILGDDHTNVANFYCIVGNLHKNRGSDRLAKEMYEQALDIYSKEFNQDHPSVADTYVGFADIYKNQGDFSKAEEYYNRAIDIYASYFDQTMNPRYGPAWLGRADIHKNKGSYQKAIDLYNKALDLSLKTVGEIHQHTATAYLGLANTYMYQEKFKEALKYYNKVLDVNFNLVGAEHESTAAAYNNLGSLYYFAGDFDLAENYLLRALRTDIAIHGSKHPNVANAYYNLARIQGEIGNTRRALEYTQSAINASISDFNKSITFINPVIVNFFSNRDLLTYLSYKGKMLKARVSQSRNMKGLDLAIRGFLQSDSLVDEVRKSYSERHDEVELATLTENIYESAVHGCYKTLQALNKENVREIGQNVSYNEKKSEYENSFFHFIEKKKVVTLFSSVAKANAKSYGAVPDSLLKKDKELKKRISRYSEELSYVTNALRIVELQDSLFKVNRQYEKFIAKIEKEFPRYYELKYDLGILSLADLQSFIDSKTAVLSYLLTKEKLYTAKITQNNFQIISASLDPNLDRKIRSFRNAVLDADKKSYLELGYALYKQFFPTELTKDIEKVIVIPAKKGTVPPF